MRVYILMGTHVPEVHQCMEYLARADESAGGVEFHIPEGLNWIPGKNSDAEIKPYDPESVLWVLDPDTERTAFIFIDPHLNPVEELEALAGDLAKCQIEPVKIVTCIDCGAVEGNLKLKAYYDACIYYSDVVLLGNRQAASKAFPRNFEKQYQRDCYPCLFMLLKGPGNPEEPAEVLTPGIRRISQLFDLGTAADEPEVPGLIIEASCDLDLEEVENDPFRTPGPSEAPLQVPDASGFIVF